MSVSETIKSNGGWLAGMYAVVLAIVGAVLFVGGIILSMHSVSAL